MIHKLLEPMIVKLKEAIPAVTRIVTGPILKPPVQEDMPLVVLSPGPLETSRETREKVIRTENLTLKTVREFHQELRVDIYAPTAAEREQWASLVTALLLTAHDTLAAAYNQSMEKGYQKQGLTSIPSIQGYRWLKAIPANEENPLKYRLLFRVEGRLEFTMTTPEGAARIKEVTLDVTTDQQRNSPGE